MPIRMTKSGDKSFALTIEDRFDPQDDHVVEIIDMDTRDDVSTIDGKPYTSLVWKYRIFDQDGVAFLDQVDGSAWEGWEFTSMALTPKAKARGWASAFVGHELTDEEADAIADNFDGAIVGKRARVSWKVEEKNGGTRIRFGFVRPMPTRAAALVAPTAGNATNVVPTVAPTTQTTPVAPQANNGSRETPAQRRARLEAELASIGDDNGGDDDLPF